MSHAHHRPVVLLVEEETHERAAITEHLQAAGYHVLETSDTDQASAYLGRSSVQALVTDAHVPGRLGGVGVAARVRARYPRAGVVLMSGHSDASSGPVPEGAEFVAKPYLTTHLVPALDRLIRGEAA